MSVETIERAFRESVSSRIELIPDGENRYRVLNPFVLDDGDHLSIVLRHEGDGRVFTDESNTWMRLLTLFKSASRPPGFSMPGREAKCRPCATSCPDETEDAG